MGFFGSEIILLFHVVMFIFESSHLLCFGICSKIYHNNAQKALTQHPRQMLFIRHLNYRMKLLMCCHSCWYVWTSNEASSHITLAEMNRHMHAVCVWTLTHTATSTARASGSFVMHSQGASLSDSCGGLLTPRSPM